MKRSVRPARTKRAIRGLDRIQKIAAMMRQGKSFQQIGDTLGISRERIRQLSVTSGELLSIRHELRLGMPSPQEMRQREKTILLVQTPEKSNHQIAQETGIPLDSVMKLRRRLIQGGKLEPVKQPEFLAKHSRQALKLVGASRSAWVVRNRFQKFFGRNFRESTVREWMQKNALLPPRRKNAFKERLVTFRGKKWKLADLAREVGINYQTLHGRIVTMGWNLERAISTPSRGFAIPRKPRPRKVAAETHGS